MSDEQFVREWRRLYCAARQVPSAVGRAYSRSYILSDKAEGLTPAQGVLCQLAGRGLFDTNPQAMTNRLIAHNAAVYGA